MCHVIGNDDHVPALGVFRCVEAHIPGQHANGVAAKFSPDMLGSKTGLNPLGHRNDFL